MSAVTTTSAPSPAARTTFEAKATAGRMVALTAFGANPTFWFGADLSPEQARTLAEALSAAADVALTEVAAA